MIENKRSNRDYVRHLEEIEKLIEAGGGGGDSEAIKYTEQTLTAEQQAQARENIGAADVSSLNGKKIWTGSAADYAQLTPSNDTIYFITP